MSGDGQADLTELWQQHWPSCPPVGYKLRGPYRDVWVRFHSLLESKRYAEDESEGNGDDAQARDLVDAAFDTETGAPLTVASNPTFLLDGLGAIDADVIISIVAPTKRAVITGADKDGKDLGEGALEYLLMPVRLSN